MREADGLVEVDGVLEFLAAAEEEGFGSESASLGDGVRDEEAANALPRIAGETAILESS